MISRSDLYYDPGNSKQINSFRIQGDINLNQGVSIAFFLCHERAPPQTVKTKNQSRFWQYIMAHKQFKFFNSCGCFFSTFVVHYVKGTKDTDFLAGKEVKK